MSGRDRHDGEGIPLEANDGGNDNHNHNNNDNNNNPVEQVFQFIEQGNAHVDAGDEWWEASDAFCQAFELLQRLAADAAAQVNAWSTLSEQNEAEQIRRLYQTQADTYQKEARRCLIQALQHEHEANAVPELETDEEALSRTDLFVHLFSKPVHVGVVGADMNIPVVTAVAAAPSADAATATATAAATTSISVTAADNTDWNTTSLEERLAALNASLPAGFKTSEERMRDINRGLNRLGLSSVVTTTTTSNSNPFTGPSWQITPNKSESEQVEDILAQVADEVALQRATAAASAGDDNPTAVAAGDGKVPTNNDVDSISDASISSNSSSDNDSNADSVGDSPNDKDEDAMISPPLTANVMQVVQDKVVDAQATLAELLALLQDAQDDQKDDEAAASVTEVLLDRRTAQQSLRTAVKFLKQAQEQLRPPSLPPPAKLHTTTDTDQDKTTSTR